MARLLAGRLRYAVVLDLECLPDSARALAMQAFGAIQCKGPVILTAANIPIERIPPDFNVLLLLPSSKDEYIARVAERNEKEQGKVGQNESQLYDGFSCLKERRSFFAVIDPVRDAATEDQLANLLVERLGLAAWRV